MTHHVTSPPRQEDREYDEQHGEDDEDDLLLSDANAS
jgi:hypothetical protein